MADIQLRVSPEELKKRAGEIGQHVTAAHRYWNELCGIVKASEYYWEGGAGDGSRRLRAHPSSLMQMAGIYSEAEAQAAVLAKVLPDNVLS